MSIYGRKMAEWPGLARWLLGSSAPAVRKAAAAKAKAQGKCGGGSKGELDSTHKCLLSDHVKWQIQVGGDGGEG